MAELADAGVSEENAIRDLVEHAADNGAANPVTGGLAVPAPLTAAASKNTAQALPVMRAPDALKRPATVSALPTDGAAGDTLSPAPAATGEAKPAMPARASDAQALNGTLERSRLDTRLGANQEGCLLYRSPSPLDS